MVVTKEQLQFLLSEEILFKGACTDLSFSVLGDDEFSECWLGKMPDPCKKEKDVYWLGLRADGSEAYYYASAGEMLSAKVIDGKSLLQLANRLSWQSIDGEDFDTMVRYYLQIE